MGLFYEQDKPPATDSQQPDAPPKKAKPELLPPIQRYAIAALLVFAIWLMTYVCEC